ncbi:MAG: hypothetical protein V3V01_05050 [Acidimicrobiales bacterium]
MSKSDNATAECAPAEPRIEPAERSWAKTAAVFSLMIVLALLLAEGATRWLVDPKHEVQILKVDPFVEQHVQRMTLLGALPDDERVRLVMSGTSIVGVALDPDIVGAVSGLPAYNAAIGCANLDIQSEWLPNWVADFANPDVVVIGVAPGDFDATACVRDWDDRKKYDYTGPDLDWELFKKSSLWRQRKFLAEPQNWEVFWNQEEIINFWELDISAETGFWDVVEFRDEPNQMLNANRTKLVFDKLMTEGLANSIVSLQERDIQVVVLEIPMAQRFVDNLSDKENEGVPYEEASRLIRELAEDNGAIYIGALDPAFRRDELFIDESHLKPAAAKAFSEWFGRELASVLG